MRSWMMPWASAPSPGTAGDCPGGIELDGDEELIVLTDEPVTVAGAVLLPAEIHLMTAVYPATEYAELPARLASCRC
jgi:hypothetical protein